MKTRWSSAKRETWCIFVRREPRPIGRTDTLPGVLKGLFKVFVFNLTRDYDLDLPIFWARGAARYRWRCRYFGTRASIRCGSKSWENDWGGLQSSSNDVPMWTYGVRPRGWTLYHALPFFFGSMVVFSCFYSSDQWERGHSARKLDPEVPMIGFGGLWTVVENLFRHFFFTSILGFPFYFRGLNRFFLGSFVSNTPIPFQISVTFTHKTMGLWGVFHTYFTRMGSSTMDDRFQRQKQPWVFHAVFHPEDLSLEVDGTRQRLGQGRTDLEHGTQET